MNPVRKLAAWTLTALLATSSLARAAGPLDDRVPRDAIVYIGWAGAQSLAPQYANSNLKGVVDASAARDFINQQFPRLIDMAAQRDPQGPQIIAKFQTGLNVAWNHPCAFYFCPIDFTTPEKPSFRFAFTCDAGSDAKTLADLLTEARAKLPPAPEPPIQITTEGTLVTINFGKSQTLADRTQGGGLAASPAYVKATGQLKIARPALMIYADAAQVLATINDGLEKTPGLPPEAKAKANAVIDALGLHGLTQAASAAGFDGKEWSEQAFIGMTATRQGLLSVVNTRPLSTDLLAVVPQDAVSFATLKLDPHQIFSEIRTIAGKLDASVLRDFDRSVADTNQQTGMNLEQDFLAPLGDEWVFYRAPLSDIGGNTFALVQRLRDADRFAKTITQTETLINAWGQGQFKIDKGTSSKIDFSSVSFLQYSLAWTVRNGYLYLSSIEGLPGAVKQVENKRPNIAESDLYKKAVAALPAGVQPMSIAYSNPAKTYPELRRLALGLLPIARASGLDLPAGLLPDIDDVSQFMTPGANISWVDAAGLHIAGRSAFPGADILGGNPGGGPTMVAATAMATAVTLPALSRAREQAKRVADAASLKQIALGCMLYAADNNQMPDELARVVAKGYMDPRPLASPRLGTPPLVMTPELKQLAENQFAKFSAQLAPHCDYVYLGKEMSTSQPNPSDTIIAYDKPGPAIRDGINAAFLDGHVEFISLRMLPEKFVITNDFLKSKGLPPVDTDEIIKNAGLNPPPPFAPARPGGLP